MEDPRLPCRKWVLAIYLHKTPLNGVSSIRLHRDLGVTQKTASFIFQRIREAFRRDDDDEPPMGGPVEVNETCMGGKRKNMSNATAKESHGHGPVGMAAFVGVKDRDSDRINATVVQSTNKDTLQGFIIDNASLGATVCTDEARACSGMPFDHETVCRLAGEYVQDMARTNGMEGFWAVLKRAHKAVCQHVQRQAIATLRDGLRGPPQRP